MPQPSRRLQTVLFLDMVGSTAIAAQLGDARWREVLTRFNRIVRTELNRSGGHEEDTAGDGYFATFDHPTQAVRAACAIAQHVRDLGLEVRCGLHTGETEAIDGKRGGLGVVIGARVMSLGGAGDVLVTSTTKDLVTGSGIEFEELSAHELKGVPGTWQIFSVARLDGVELARPLSAGEAVERLQRIEPEPFARRHSRVLVGSGIALAIVATVAVVAAVRATSPSNAAPAADPVTLVRLDPETNVMGPVLRDGYQSLHRPRSVQFDSPSLWQWTPDESPTNGQVDSRLIRRDPSSGKVLQTYPVDTGDGMGFVFGFGWVAHYEGTNEASLDKVDPVTGKVVATIDLPGELADVNAGPHTLWYLSTQGDLVEIDPITTKKLHTYTIDAFAPSRVVPLIGYVWICDCDNGQILRFDPSIGRVTLTVDLQQKGFLFGVDSSQETTLWLVDPQAGTITPLDPVTGEPGRPLGVGGSAIYDAKIGFGAIWVAAGSQVVRFDLSDQERHTIAMPAGASAGGLAMDTDDGIIWVENCGCPTS
jgi:class 3 adenylate cyclase/streptogramin lyase